MGGENPAEVNDVGLPVLIVEDNPDSRQAIEQVLKSAGFVVTHCWSPSLAMEALKANPGKFAAVVSDVVFHSNLGSDAYDVLGLAIDQGTVAIMLTASYNVDAFDGMILVRKSDENLPTLPDVLRHALKEKSTSGKDGTQMLPENSSGAKADLTMVPRPRMHVETPLSKYRLRVGTTDALFVLDLQDLLKRSLRAEMEYGQVCSKRELNAMLEAYEIVSGRLGRDRPIVQHPQNQRAGVRQQTLDPATAKAGRHATIKK